MSWPVLAIGVLVMAAIGFGFWLWSIRSVDDPVDADPVDAYAVVVTSPACTSGTGSTVVDLNLNPVVRSSLSACGRRVGERVAVQYLAGHPDQARLAGTAVAHNSAGRWLPIAILAAGLLAVLGTLLLLFDRRRSRHDGRPTGAGARPTVAQLRAAAAAEQEQPARAALAPVDGTDVPDDADPETTTRIAAGDMLSAGVTPLRPSDIAVDEDLFTHRPQHQD